MPAPVRRAAVALLLAVPSLATAQARTGTTEPRWVGSMGDDYTRLLQLTGAAPLSSRMIRPLPRASALAGDSSAAADPWRWRRGGRSDSGATIALIAPAARLVYNSAIPQGANDAALWAGRGVSAATTLGAELRAGGLTVRLAPTFAWSQNSSFTLAPLVDPATNSSPYADQWLSAHIDRPQRFGDAAFTTVDLGESVVRYDWRAVAVGAGTESMWWGPGIDDALLMTNNAGGVPHGFVGTGRPVSVGIGRVEAMYMVGRLYDSDYWRTGTQANRDRRWMSALVATFEPKGAPGLYLGGGRVFYAYIPAGGLSLGDYLDVLQPFQKKKLATPDNPDGNDATDQMLSLWARWVFPEAGFEVYGEWGRNDHSWDGRDFTLEPDHASAKLLGFQKVFRQSRGLLRLRGEATSLAVGRTVELRAAPSWYAHHIVTQGYTQRGQVVGAAIGPGSDAQRFLVEWLRRWGSIGAEVERRRDDSDAFYAEYSPQGAAGPGRVLHDVWLGGGVRGTIFAGPVDVSARLTTGKELNRYSVYKNDVTNARMELRGEWRW